MDKKESYSSDASPERETWRRNKKQRTVSQSRESSVLPAKQRRVVQSEQGLTEFPSSRPGGQQHAPPFISMQSQSNQISPGMFYPHPFPYQHMWFNSPQCDSGFGNWPVPSVRPSMAPPPTSCSMASVQNRRSSGNNSDADGVSIFAPMDDSLVDQESQGSKRADKRPKPPSLLLSLVCWGQESVFVCLQ